ncbi:MAG: biotin/lipoyl-binding protein, partial [Myxococcota bacterium]
MTRIGPSSRSAFALLLALVVACGGEGGSQSAAAPEVPLVEAVAARSGSVPIAETLPGVVRAANQVEIRPELEGRIVEVLANNGDAVRRGQALVRIDPAEARERAEQAEAEVKLAEATVVAARARAAESE